MEVEFRPSASREYLALEEAARKRVEGGIEALRQGHGDVRKLRGPRSLYRLRVGDFRVIFERDPKLGKLIVISVRHRKDAYRTR